MQCTSDEVVCVNSLLLLFISWVTLHTAVERQKSNCYFCMPTKTKKMAFSALEFVCLHMLTVWLPIRSMLTYVTTGR